MTKENKNAYVVLVGMVLFFTLFITLLIFVLVNKANDKPESNLPKVTISTYSEDVEIAVEVADSYVELQKGLMHRTELDEDSGMLFVFNETIEGSFWMKNTLIPLDMIFIDDRMVVVDIQENAQPCASDPCPEYLSKYPYRYVIEANGGWTEDNDVIVGDIVDLSEAL